MYFAVVRCHCFFQGIPHFTMCIYSIQSHLVVLTCTTQQTIQSYSILFSEHNGEKFVILMFHMATHKGKILSLSFSVCRKVTCQAFCHHDVLYSSIPHIINLMERLFFIIYLFPKQDMFACEVQSEVKIIYQMAQHLIIDLYSQHVLKDILKVLEIG